MRRYRVCVVHQHVEGHSTRAPCRLILWAFILTCDLIELGLPNKGLYFTAFALGLPIPRSGSLKCCLGPIGASYLSKAYTCTENSGCPFWAHARYLEHQGNLSCACIPQLGHTLIYGWARVVKNVVSSKLVVQVLALTWPTLSMYTIFC